MDTQARLTAQEVSDNYSFFRENSDKIRFRDLADGKGSCRCGSDGCESEKLKKRVADLEAELKRKTTETSAAFSIMERAVKDDPDVKALRDSLSKTKSSVLHDLCMDKDAGYRNIHSQYTMGVERAYKNGMTEKEKEGKG
jgi:hypothetical protein